jgi:hypothetical protein
MNGDKKHPYVKWYGRDWIGDTMLRMCTPEERGIWIDLLCLMMDGNPYGHLAINGEALTDEETARVIGCDVATFKGILYRIEKRGIASRTEAGMLYSRRLVRDHKRFIDGSKFGKKGGGNPALHSESENHIPESRIQKPEAKGGLKVSFIGEVGSEHSFEESAFFEFEVFRAALPLWDVETCREYHEKALDYSQAKNARYANWVAAVRNWKRTDEKSGRRPNAQPKQQGDKPLSDWTMYELNSAIDAKKAALDGYAESAQNPSNARHTEWKTLNDGLKRLKAERARRG